MTDTLMKIYLDAKEDREFMNQCIEIARAPQDSSGIDDKKYFAYIYAGWLLGKGKWVEYATKKQIFE
jgi:hypothetical protein